MQGEWEGGVGSEFLQAEHGTININLEYSPTSIFFCVCVCVCGWDRACERYSQKKGGGGRKKFLSIFAVVG